jgi:hypothetical protein
MGGYSKKSDCCNDGYNNVIKRKSFFFKISYTINKTQTQQVQTVTLYNDHNRAVGQGVI